MTISRKIIGWSRLRPTSFLASWVILALGSPSLAWDRGAAACAAWDLHLLTEMEVLGEADALAADILGTRAEALQRARLACRTGDVARGVHLYESLDRQGGPRTAALR